MFSEVVPSRNTSAKAALLHIPSIFQNLLCFQSYCNTTHIEAGVTLHLFERGMHCWSKPGFGLGCFE